MNNVTITDYASANEAVELFAKSRDESNLDTRKQRLRFQAHDRKNLYGILQQAYGIAVQLVDPSNEAVLDQLLDARDLKRKKGNQWNPYMPVVNILFGKSVGMGTSKLRFSVNKSAKKYATCFRYMADHNWPVEEVADRIEAFSNGVFGEKLLGLEATARHERTERDPDEEAELARVNDFMANAHPFTVIDRDILNGLEGKNGIEQGTFVNLWGRLVGNNVFVYGVMPPGSRKAALSQAVRTAQEVQKFLDDYMAGTPKQREEGTIISPRRAREKVWRPMLDARLAKEAEEAEQRKHAEQHIKHQNAQKRGNKGGGIRLGGKVQLEQEAAHAA